MMRPNKTAFGPATAAIEGSHRGMLMRMRRVVLPCLLLLAPAPAFAAEVELQSKIDRVTVFPDAAVVTRIAPLDLAAGASTLFLRGLPGTLDPASIRVEGAGAAAFAIGGIDVRATPGEARPVIDAELERRLKGLRDERDGVQARIGAAQGKKATIERYAQASPEKLGVEAKPLEVAQWQAAWEAIGGGLAAVNEEVRTLTARVRDLDAEIAALERARPQPPRPGAPKRDVAVAVEGSSQVKGELRVSYRVAGAGWAPIYDARLETAGKDTKPSLELVRRAQVTQRTGEDWGDVALAVSTVRVNRGAAAPDLPPLQVSFYEPRPVAQGRPAPMSRSMEARDEVAARAAAPAAPLAKAEEVEATVEAGAFQATFNVPGRVTVPQDASKSVVLAKRALAPNLLVRTAPVIDETAYLEASFVNEDEAPLLPGEVAIHRDGAYVGKARLKLTATGDTVDLGFGADDRVKIVRVPLRRRENEPSWIGQTKTDLREFKTTVRNLHAQPIRITVVDRLPFSENTAIQVELLRETTPSTEKQVNDKRGVMAWTSDYQPGEQKEIRLAYRVKWPAERDLVYEPKPIGR
ncbi:MAG: hypothetical protein K0S06_3352 [Microvirga sp.]|jgi:uncharacterized protein (TIGR02231 family)|nr:hypothetical protein [Microvirga sp.]